MYNAFYSLASNPFDKQQLSEKDCFKSHDFTEIFNKHLSESRAKGKIDLPNSMPDNPSKPRKGFH